MKYILTTTQIKVLFLSYLKYLLLISMLSLEIQIHVLKTNLELENHTIERSKTSLLKICFCHLFVCSLFLCGFSFFFNLLFILCSSVGTFARALDCSSSVRQPSLHMSAAAASRDITLVRT